MLKTVSAYILLVVGKVLDILEATTVAYPGTSCLFKPILNRFGKPFLSVVRSKKEEAMLIIQQHCQRVQYLKEVAKETGDTEVYEAFCQEEKNIDKILRKNNLRKYVTPQGDLTGK